MIARVRLLLPSYVGMLDDEYLSVQLTKHSVPSYKITVHPPIRVRREIPDGYKKQEMKAEEMLLGWQPVKRADALSGNTVEDKPQWWANCLIIDFHGDEFSTDKVPPEIVTIAAEIANDLLARLRWRGKQHYIKEIKITRTDDVTRVETEHLVEYLADDGGSLPKDSAYRRSGATSFQFTTGAVTPAAWERAWRDMDEDVDVPLWEQLLLDVAASEVVDGRVVVMSFTALEVFIRMHLGFAAAESSKDDSFWEWLLDRGGDIDRQPAIAELFDQVLFYAEGRSLKIDSPEIWSEFQDLRKTRNRLVHEGNDPNLTREKIGGLVRTTWRIIDWVRQKEVSEPSTSHLKFTIESSDAPPETESLKPRQDDDTKS